jgi:hypothetical protein
MSTPARRPSSPRSKISFSVNENEMAVKGLLR